MVLLAGAARVEALSDDWVVRFVTQQLEKLRADLQTDRHNFQRSTPNLTGLEMRVDQMLGALSESTRRAERQGPEPPRLSADKLHGDVWLSAAPAWDHGHRRDAVLAACRAVNVQLQDKVNRRDVSETQLVREAWSTNDPTPDVARLRVLDVDKDEAPQTWKSLHEGARAFGEGLFTRIRNVLDHAPPDLELDEQEAFEYLAALSAFARWVDDATAVYAFDGPEEPQ